MLSELATMLRGYGELRSSLRSCDRANIILSIAGMFELQNVTISNSRYGNNLYPARRLELRDRLQFQGVTWHAMARDAFARNRNHPRLLTEHDRQIGMLTALH